MIIRRMADAIRTQNWFTVIIEILIVVIGIFLGLQVDDWNQARLDRARAEVYSQQLTAELRGEYEYTNSLIEYYVSNLRASNAAYDGLAGKAALDDETILINAFRASQYNWYERRRAVFDEIVASGAMALISDVALRDTAIIIYNSPIFAIAQSEGQSSRYRDLFRMAIEPSLHNDLVRYCGDKDDEDGIVAVGLVTLDYTCTLTVSVEDVAQGVQALRDDPEILKALKLRSAQVSGRLSDMTNLLRTLGLGEMFQEGAP